jgi:branched-chain amino acid transport system ATP-binding protein
VELVTLLEVRDLHVRYGGVVAVRGIDVSVDPGSVEVVLGANGAGKSSTLRAICAQVKKSGGHVQWDGVDISDWPTFKIARAGLVMVPEGRRVFGPMSVYENLLLGGYHNRSKARRDEILERIFSVFPILEERRTQAAGLLSGGEQQMLAFGRALMAEPRVILMDEPSMGLSPAMVDVIMDSIADIARTGIGILMVEQNAMAALDIADAVVVLERGHIVLKGTADEIRTHPDVVKAFLGEKAQAE